MDVALDLEKARGSTDAVSAAARRRELHKKVAQQSSSSELAGRGSSSRAGSADATPAPQPQSKPTLAGLAASAKARNQSVGARMDFRLLSTAGSSSSSAASSSQSAVGTLAAGKGASPKTGPVPPLPSAHTATAVSATRKNSSGSAIAKALSSSQNRAFTAKPSDRSGGLGRGRGMGQHLTSNALGNNDELRKLKQMGAAGAPLDYAAVTAGLLKSQRASSALSKSSANNGNKNAGTANRTNSSSKDYMNPKRSIHGSNNTGSNKSTVNRSNRSSSNFPAGDSSEEEVEVQIRPRRGGHMYSSSSSLSSDGAGAAARLPMPGFGQPPMAEAIKAMAIGSVSASSSSLTTGAAAGAARTIAANHAANSSAEMRSVSRFDATSSNTGSAVVAASASAPVPSSSSSSSSLSSSFSSSTTAARLAAARALSSEPTSDDSNAQTGSGAAPTTGARTSAGPAVAHPASITGAASSMHSTAGLKARPLPKNDPKAAYRQRIARALSAQPDFNDICSNSSSDITAPLQPPLEAREAARETSSSRSAAAVAASGAAAKDTNGEGKERAAADDGEDRSGDEIMGDWLDSEAISSAKNASGFVNNSTLSSRGRPTCPSSSLTSSSSTGALGAARKAPAGAAAATTAAASAAHLAEWAEARRLKREGIDVNAAPPPERKKKPVEVENYQRLHLDKRRVGTQHKSKGAGSKPKGSWRKDQRLASERAAEDYAAAAADSHHSGDGAFAASSSSSLSLQSSSSVKASNAGAAALAAKEADRVAWQRARESRAAGAGIDALDLCLDAMQELRPLEQKSSLSGSNETSRSISSIDSTASCSSSSSSRSTNSIHTSLLAQDSAADEQWENLDVDAIAAAAAAATSREKESFVSAQPSAAAEAVRAATAAAHKLRTALVLAEATRAGGGSSSGGGNLRIGRTSKGSNADAAAAAVLAEVAPLCFGHQEPTRVVVVKKTGPNKGRQFFSCCRPREDQCDFFMWVEDHPDLVKATLLGDNAGSEGGGKQRGGDISLVGASEPNEARWRERQLRDLRKRTEHRTVPELTAELKRHGLSKSGGKASLVDRLVKYVAYELVKDANTKAGLEDPDNPANGPPNGGAEDLSPAEVLRRQNLAILKERNAAAVASAGLSEYEATRQANMAKNHAMLVSLGLATADDAPGAGATEGVLGRGLAPRDESKPREQEDDSSTESDDDDDVEDEVEDDEEDGEENAADDDEVEDDFDVSSDVEENDEDLEVETETMPKQDNKKQKKQKKGGGIVPEENDKHELKEVNEDGAVLNIGARKRIRRAAATVNYRDKSGDDDDDDDNESEDHSSDDAENKDDDDDEDDDDARSNEGGSNSRSAPAKKRTTSNAALSAAKAGSTTNTNAKKSISIDMSRKSKSTRGRKNDVAITATSSSYDDAEDLDNESLAFQLSSPLSKELGALRRKLWGHCKGWRPGQCWGLSVALNKKRGLLVAPTGTGKSLCYQLPALVLPGVTVVVSPLVALMQEQLASLPPLLQVRAATLSGQNGGGAGAVAQTLSDLAAGRLKLLFVSPERLASPAFRRMWTTLRPRPEVSLLCVDEAHCVSQWSHNFRPAYLRLGSVVDSWMLPSAVLALTATAPQAVAHDVCRQLRLHKHCRQEEEEEDGKAGEEVDCGAAGISASTVGRTAGTERKATGEAVTVMELVPPRMDKMMDKDEGEQKEAFSESLWLHRAGGWSRPNLTLTVQQFGVENNSGSGSSGGGSYGSGSNKSSSGGALSPQRLKTIVDALNFQDPTALALLEAAKKAALAPLKAGEKRNRNGTNRTRTPLVEARAMNGSAIVYATSQWETEVLAEQLASELGERVVAYHAGMDPSDRVAAQAAWTNGRARICVATVAFGMGIDKANVRLVVHAALPRSIEQYVQEVGRAGRDGKPARCLALLDANDAKRHHSLAHRDNASRAQIRELLRLVFGLSSSGGAKDTSAMTHSNLRLVTVEAATVALDVRKEALETIVTLLEQPPFSLLHFEADSYDTVVLTSAQTAFSELAKQHPVIAALFDSRSSDEDRSYASSARQAAKRDGTSRFGNSSNSGKYSFSGNSSGGGGAGKYGAKYGKGKGGKGYRGGEVGEYGGIGYGGGSRQVEDYQSSGNSNGGGGGGGGVSAGFGHEATCSMAGAMQRYGKSPQEICRELHKLQSDGVITYALASPALLLQLHDQPWLRRLLGRSPSISTATSAALSSAATLSSSTAAAATAASNELEALTTLVHCLTATAERNSQSKVASVFQALQAGAAAQQAIAEFGETTSGEISEFSDDGDGATGSNSSISTHESTLHEHIETYFRGDSNNNVHAMLTAVKTAADACRASAVAAAVAAESGTKSVHTTVPSLPTEETAVGTAAREAVSAVAVVHEAGTLMGEAEARSSLPWAPLTPDVEEKVRSHVKLLVTDPKFLCGPGGGPSSSSSSSFVGGAAAGASPGARTLFGLRRSALLQRDPETAALACARVLHGVATEALPRRAWQGGPFWARHADLPFATVAALAEAVLREGR